MMDCSSTTLSIFFTEPIKIPPLSEVALRSEAYPLRRDYNSMAAAKLCPGGIIIAIRVIIAHAHLSSQLCPPSINCGTGHAPWQAQYRVGLVVWQLGWVDLDLGSSPAGGPLL